MLLGSGYSLLPGLCHSRLLLFSSIHRTKNVRAKDDFQHHRATHLQLRSILQQRQSLGPPSHTSPEANSLGSAMADHVALKQQKAACTRAGLLKVPRGQDTCFDSLTKGSKCMSFLHRAGETEAPDEEVALIRVLSAQQEQRPKSTLPKKGACWEGKSRIGNFNRFSSPGLHAQHVLLTADLSFKAQATHHLLIFWTTDSVPTPQSHGDWYGRF